jgi:hypothetical protein
MTKGSSPTLFMDELILLLFEIASLKGVALEVIDEDVEMNYVLLPYFFNLNQAKDNMESLVRTLEAIEDKSSAIGLIEDKDTIEPNKESYLGFADLIKRDQEVDERIRVSFTAYQDVIQSNRPLRVIAENAERQWRFATSQLSLAKEKYYKG